MHMKYKYLVSWKDSLGDKSFRVVEPGELADTIIDLTEDGATSILATFVEL